MVSARYGRLLSDSEILELYKNGSSVPEIAIKSGVSQRAIRNVFYKYGVKLKRGQPRKHKINESFFEEWNHNMAWVLGMIFTDGHLSNKSTTIVITQKDIGVLNDIASIMDCEPNITKQYDSRTARSLLINSKKMCDDLIDIGLSISNKSISLKLPSVPREFLPSFIRGVIDGDGHVDREGYTVCITSASESFSNSIVEVLKSFGIKSDITNSVSPNGTNIFRIWIRGKKETVKLSEIIYKDAQEKAFLSRKRVLMTTHSNTPFYV